MANRRNKYLGGGGGTLLSGVWLLYSNFTTAKDLPDDAGWIAKMLADPPVYAPWLLLAACIVFLALVFWHRDDPDERADGTYINQNTGGDGSHAIINHGTIHLNAPAPAATQPEKRPQGAAELMASELRKVKGTWAPELREDLHKPEPDINLTGILVRVYAMLGPVPVGNIDRAKWWRKVNLAIADKAATVPLHTWGRFGKNKALLPLIASDWQVGEFDHRRNVLEVPVPYNTPTVYADLHFWKHEVDKIWPEPLRTTNDDKP